MLVAKRESYPDTIIFRSNIIRNINLHTKEPLNDENIIVRHREKKTILQNSDITSSS